MITREMSPIISVFGSHSPAPGSSLYEMARALGFRLTQAGFTVASGGYEGVMAAVSQGAAEAGGKPIGVTSSNVEASRNASLNRWIKTEIRYDTLQDRLFHLVNDNSGMIVLEGGIGTLSEFSLAWSLIQVGEIEKRPLVLLGQLWKDVLHSFVRQEYVPDHYSRLIQMVDSPADAITYLLEHQGGSSEIGDNDV